RAIVRVHHFHPERSARNRAGVFAPLVVDVLDAAGGVGRPYHVRYRAGQLAEARLALAHRALHVLLARDVGERHHPTADAELGVDQPAHAAEQVHRRGIGVVGNFEIGDRLGARLHQLAERARQTAYAVDPLAARWTEQA